MFNYRKKIVLLIIIVSFFLFANSAYAIQILPTPTGSCPGDVPCVNGVCQGGPGVNLECNYSLADFIEVFVNISKIILGILGAVALLFFVYGGITWLTSAGSSDKIKKGKDILVGTITGLVLVLGAYAIVSFVQTAIGLKWGRLPETHAPTAPPKGCCVYFYPASGEYAADFITSTECANFISGHTPHGSIISKGWHPASSLNECDNKIAAIAIGCCIYRTFSSDCYWKVGISDEDCTSFVDAHYYEDDVLSTYIRVRWVATNDELDCNRYSLHEQTPTCP